MKKAVFLTLFVSQFAFAKVTWFARACEVFLLQAPAKATPELHRVSDEMDTEINHANRFFNHLLTKTLHPLDFLEGSPVGLEIHPKVSQLYTVVRPVPFIVFANPGYIAMDWKDTSKGLSEAPALIALFENVSVHNGAGRELKLEEMMQEEMEHVLARNPDMKLQLRTGSVKDLPGLKFEPEVQGFSVAWIEGRAANWQTKRALLLAVGHAFQHVVTDPHYTIRKNTKE